MPGKTWETQGGLDMQQTEGGDQEGGQGASLANFVSQLGFPLFAISTGLALTGRTYLWGGLVLMTLGLVSTVAAVINLVPPKFKDWFGKFMIIGMALVLYGWVICWLFPNTKPDMFIVPDLNHYPAGHEAYGIRWNGWEWVVLARMRNETEFDYTNVDIYAQTNLFIDRVGFAPGINHCVSAGVLPGVQVFGASMRAESNGRTIPLLTNDTPVVATVYRIQCDKISARSQLDLALSITGNNGQAPAWAALSMDYDAANRRHSPSIPPQCYNKSCRGLMPEPVPVR